MSADFAETPTETTAASSRSGWYRIHVYNRTALPATIELTLAGGQTVLSQTVEARTTFAWGLRYSGLFSLTPRRGTEILPVLTGALSAAVRDLHLIVDDLGARLYDPASRAAPGEPNGINRVQVGCGPHNLFVDWWNVDIRAFPGVDAQLDVTDQWPYQNLDFVYGEHFLEHLELMGAVRFLVAAGNSLKPGGVLRLTTPNLEWVVRTHFPLEETADKVAGTFAVNRAFHGWGHQFLYSRPFLSHLLTILGYREIQFFDYGESRYPELRNLERHGGFRYEAGGPNLLVVEAVPEGPIKASRDIKNWITRHFGRYVSGGH